MLATTANANLVLNGNFGSGDFNDWAQVGPGPDGVTTGAVDAISPLSGYTYFAIFGATGSEGGIQTTVATTVGSSYVFSFWLANNYGSSANDTISWNGTTVLAQNNPGPFGWTQYSYDVTATSTSTLIDFGFEQDQSYFGLAGVDVEPLVAPVPEPGTYFAGALMLLPFGVSGLRMLRKNRKA